LFQFAIVAEVCTASTTRVTMVMMLETVQTSATMANSNQSTRRYNPEESHLYKSKPDKHEKKECDCEIFTVKSHGRR
jgi:hypothetical protein